MLYILKCTFSIFFYVHLKDLLLVFTIVYQDIPLVEIKADMRNQSICLLRVILSWSPSQEFHI